MYEEKSIPYQIQYGKGSVSDRNFGLSFHSEYPNWVWCGLLGGYVSREEIIKIAQGMLEIAQDTDTGSFIFEVLP